MSASEKFDGHRYLTADDLRARHGECDMPALGPAARKCIVDCRGDSVRIGQCPINDCAARQPYLGAALHAITRRCCIQGQKANSRGANIQPDQRGYRLL